MNMAKLFKRVGTLLLCVTLCLCMAAPTFAADNAAIGKANYYYQYDDGTETYVGGVAKIGNYKARINVYNYDKETALSDLLMITAIYNADGILENIVTDAPEAAIANGTVTTLETSFNLPTEDKKVRSFVWQNLAGATPVVGVLAAAPTNVAVNNDTITNSTVDLTWDASVTEGVAEYKVYRNGTYVGSTDTTSFKDVGINHNTEVSYTVAAVDINGKDGNVSEATVPVTTDDIARLWLGAANVKNGAADGTQITDENFAELLAANGGTYNIDLVDVVTADGTGIYARSGATAFNEKGQALGLAAIDFNAASNRVLGSLSEDFIAKIAADEEVKLVMNYFDNRVIAGVENVGTTKTNDGTTAKRPTVVFKYANGSALSGTAGFQQENSNKWKTRVMTIPTLRNTTEGWVDNSSALYKDVFNDRGFAFANYSKDGTGFGQTGGIPAMFALGSNNKVDDTKFHNVVIQKIDIVPGDYVPYGAVYDVDKQGDTQFIELYKPGTRNTGAITAQTDAKEVTKNAMAIYGSETATNKLFLGVDSGYISSDDKDLIIRVTYLDNYTDNRDADRLTIVYQGQNGNVTETISRRGSNTWKTAEFFVDDAAFVNGLDHGASIQFGSYTAEENAWQVSRIEIIKR